MFPATIFRQVSRNHMAYSKGIAELVGGAATSSFSAPTSVINCLNRYAAATGFIRISFLDVNQYRNWDVATLRMYADSKKQSLHMKTIKGRDILQGVIEKKRELFIERKNVIVEDIREAKHKMQERMREKIEEVYEKENILTIPNLLTVSRLGLSPYIGYVIIGGHYGVAISLLAVAGVTDLLDGQIARRWPSQASKAGSFLDPAADKILMGSLVVSMGYCDLLPLWLAGLILFRDMFLFAAGFVVRYISLPPPRTFSRYFDVTHVTAQLEPTLISKINTGVQLAAVGISLGAPVWQYMNHEALYGLWYLTGATTVAAALSYVINKNTFKILAKNKSANSFKKSS